MESPPWAAMVFFIFVIATVAAHYDDLWLKIWYVICCTIGSVHAHHISLHKIEKSKPFAKDRMVSKSELDAVAQRIEKLEEMKNAEPVSA